MANEPLKNNTDGIPLRKDREKKLRKKRERMPQHSKGLAGIYRDAVAKRTKKPAK
jgi:hypothetical protein